MFQSDAHLILKQNSEDLKGCILPQMQKLSDSHVYVGRRSKRYLGILGFVVRLIARGGLQRTNTQT